MQRWTAQTLASTSTSRAKSRTQTTNGSASRILLIQSTHLRVEFAWTLAISPHPAVDGNATRTGVQRSFYLGTPADLDLTIAVYTGCAFFFNRLDGEGFALEPQSGAPQYVASSSCAYGLGGDQCILDLQTRALQLADDVSEGQDSGSVCSSIAASLTQSAPPSCDRLVQDGPASAFQYAVHGVPLTGGSAPRPIEAAKNASSNCWPTLPKSNQLTTLYSYNFTTDDWVYPTFDYSPVMSLFFQPGSGTTSGGLRESSFHCLKVVDSDSFSEATKTNGSTTTTDSNVPNEGSRARSSKLAACIALIVISVFL